MVRLVAFLLAVVLGPAAGAVALNSRAVVDIVPGTEITPRTAESALAVLLDGAPAAELQISVQFRDLRGRVLETRRGEIQLDGFGQAVASFPTPSGAEPHQAVLVVCHE